LFLNVKKGVGIMDLDKKSMTEEDIKVKYITPAIKEADGI